MPVTSSLLDSLLSLDDAERQALIVSLPPKQAEKVLYDWQGLWARTDQVPPTWPWFVWLILAGRGWGKTRTGAECVRWWIGTGRYDLVNLIGATVDDARDIMIQGESGLLAICPRDERPIYRKSERALLWPNGARSLIFTADEPERLRGKQHKKLWADEVAAWRYARESWDQAMLGLRLGDSPQAVVTTTPRPTEVVKDLASDPRNHVTRGTSYDNRPNLAPDFFRKIITRYEGTRLGRQELLAEILDDVPGALWTRKVLDELRVRVMPDLVRIVVAIDPAVTSGENADETGIIVAGKGVDGQGYVSLDLSCQMSPDGWARRAVNAYHANKADRIIAEVNNGGEMVELTIRTVDPKVSYKGIHASRGKRTRAEPIAALYEQGRVHHLGSLPQLEDQMCNFVPDNFDGSPDRVDALVWALTELMLDPEPAVLSVNRNPFYH